MTLEELKLATLRLIEEVDEDNENLTEDTDISSKMNDCINMILHELARFKKIPARAKMEVLEDDYLDLNGLDNFYQLNVIRGVDCDIIENSVTFNEDGEVTIYYYKYPEMITEETEDDHNFELSEDVMNIAPVGIAGLILTSDPANSYGTYYLSRYQNMLQTLDSRYVMPNVYIEGGLDV